MWRNRFRGGFGPVVTQNTECSCEFCSFSSPGRDSVYSIPRVIRRCEGAEFFPCFVFFFFIVFAYSALIVLYSFLCSLRAVLPVVRWYLLLCAFTFFFRTVRFCVHHGTDLCCPDFLYKLVGMVCRRRICKLYPGHREILRLFLLCRIRKNQLDVTGIDVHYR